MITDFVHIAAVAGTAVVAGTAAGLLQCHDPCPWSKDPRTQRRAS